MPTLHDPDLEKIFQADRALLQDTDIPMVTVSGTFLEDLKHWHDQPHQNISTDIVYSRAHFSMAYGVATMAWGKDMRPQKAWLVDPSNYVSSKEWRTLKTTESIGKLIARTPLLKTVKDIIDMFGRNKLPILDSITPPLFYLFEHVHKPILSFHIAAGNILIGMGKQVVQVVTDPHIREDYLLHADSELLTLCVFDEKTKFDALEKAMIMGKPLDPDRVIVTGPPIDPRIILARKNKNYSDKRPLRLMITTGGLGTNKKEVRELLHQLVPQIRSKERKYEIMLYAGTQKDFVEMATEICKEYRVKTNIEKGIPLSPADGGITRNDRLTILYHPQLFDANEMLITQGFPWADGVICKPSGDMAYDAVAAGCFMLTLRPWGIWEEHIRDIFEQKGIARQSESEHILKQLEALQNEDKESNWMRQAMKNAEDIDPLFLSGAKNILKEYSLSAEK